MKLSVGCGNDYREDFVNVDESNSLPRVDVIIDLSSRSLLSHFAEDSAEYILANDILEHHFHWEAIKLLEQFYTLLHSNGTLEIRVPDAAYLVRTFRFAIEQKLTMLFGRQLIPQGCGLESDFSRARLPDYFAHKYGLTQPRLKHDHSSLGFCAISTNGDGANCITLSLK